MATRTRFFRGVHDTDVYVADLNSTDRHVAARTLDPRFDLRDFSLGRDSIAFAWGSSSAGASQLALALLADVLADDRKALALAGTFRDQIIARLPAGAPWIMSDNVVRALAAAIAREPVPA